MAMPDEIEDGFGCRGLVPTKQELEEERLRKQLAIANRRLAIAESALALYADVGNWDHVQNGIFGDQPWEPAANALEEMEAINGS